MSSRRVREDHHGFLLFDKPQGWTSNQALQAAKHALNAAKAGHTGSLDPLATGLLPLCFGHATRFAQFLLDADKAYEAEFRLGVTTDTYDAEGAALATHDVQVTREGLERALGRFRGVIEQIPPMYSAIKQGGRPLYERARAGEIVDRQARTVTVSEFTVLDLAGDRLSVRIQASKGTYVRSLAHDLGAELGCGAHVTSLRRLSVGGFSVRDAVGLDAVRAARAEQSESRLLLPLDAALAHLPAITLTGAAAIRFSRGQAIAVHDSEEGWWRVYDGQARLLGVGEQAGGELQPRRMLTIS